MKKVMVFVVILAAGAVWAGPKGKKPEAAKTIQPAPPHQVSAFLDAFAHGKIDTGRVLVLVEMGFPLNTPAVTGEGQQKRGGLPISIAVCSGDFAIVDYFVYKGARIPVDFLQTLLECFPREKADGLPQRILAFHKLGMAIPKDALFLYRSRGGLHGLGAIELEAPVADILLELGADPNATRKETLSDGTVTTIGPPIFGSADDRDLIRVLIKHGANVNARAEDGRPLLSLVKARLARSGHRSDQEIIDLLVAAGAKE